MLLLGNQAVGKSSLMLRFADDKFSLNMVSTTGVDFKIKEIELDGRPVVIKVWDTAGQERFKTITQSYYRGAMGIVLVYDVTDVKTFRRVEYWMKNIATYANAHVCKILVGNKCDQEDLRQVTTQEGRELAAEYKIPFIETSAKAGTNVQQVFLSLAQDILKNLDHFSPEGTSSPSFSVAPSKPATTPSARCSC